jgi:NADPH:quinone reductase-like Zn-dependent oxidoreductase
LLLFLNYRVHKESILSTNHTRVATFAHNAQSASFAGVTRTTSFVFMRLQGKRFIFVGGSSGMGKAAALLAVQWGAEVLLVSRSLARLQLAQQEILDACSGFGNGSSTDGNVQVAQLDFTQESKVKFFFESLEDANEKYDGIVLSAFGRAVSYY